MRADTSEQFAAGCLPYPDLLNGVVDEWRGCGRLSFASFRSGFPRDDVKGR